MAVNTDKNLYYIDFDRLFENFAGRYYSDHELEYANADAFEIGRASCRERVLAGV